MSKILLEVWNKKLSLDVEYDCFDDEEVLESQKQALDDFVKNAKAINTVLDTLYDYCNKNPYNKTVDKNEDIFKYVQPTSIYVCREEKVHLVALMCEYVFDDEHGLAIVFENEKFKIISTQDFVL